MAACQPASLGLAPKSTDAGLLAAMAHHAARIATKAVLELFAGSCGAAWPGLACVALTLRSMCYVIDVSKSEGVRMMEQDDDGALPNAAGARLKFSRGAASLTLSLRIFHKRLNLGSRLRHPACPALPRASLLLFVKLCLSPLDLSTPDLADATTRASPREARPAPGLCEDCSGAQARNWCPRGRRASSPRRRRSRRRR